MPNRMVGRGLVAVALAALGVSVSLSLSCNRAKSPPGRPALRGPTSAAPGNGKPAGPLAEHAVRDGRLRAVMGEISEQARKWPAGVPDDSEAAGSPESADARRAFADAASLAEGLADAAQRIPQAVRGRGMAPGDRRGFATEADRLRRQALELKAAAEGRRVERMQRALEAISSTCVACHGRYRGVAGELGARDAGNGSVPSGASRGR